VDMIRDCGDGRVESMRSVCTCTYVSKKGVTLRKSQKQIFCTIADHYTIELRDSVVVRHG
jgi:hypothetical protein